MKAFLARFVLLGSIVMLAVSLVGINILVYRHNRQWDFSGQDIYRVSERTKNILKELKEDVYIYVCFSPALRVRDWLKTLLQGYREASSYVHIEFVDPERDVSRVKELALKYSVNPTNLIIVESKGRHKVIDENKLIEMDYSPVMKGQPPVPSGFNGEEAITSAIISLTQTQAPRIVFVKGHKELSINSMAPGKGLSEAVGLLKQDGYEVSESTVLQIPLDSEKEGVLVLSSPKLSFLDEELERMTKLLEAGWGVVILADPGMSEDIRDWASEHLKVRIGDDVVVDPELNVMSPVVLFVNYYGLHQITKPLIGSALLFTQACSVRLQKLTEADKGYDLEPILFTSSSAWAEKEWRSTRYSYDKDVDEKGRIPLAACGNVSKSRIVVVGDSDFATNVAIDNLNNRSFWVSLFAWVVNKEEKIGIAPVPIKTLRLNMPARELRIVSLWSIAGLPLLVLALGIIFVWLRRRI